ncbi:MAG: discoidin domain-containing protein [Myxococcales bacterium]|nr:discoidin domain-containing protein [Myxococcales bacterium]MCB9579631.1 discoidin domain-containing protein [Polyangiaceae bacterium]
MALVLQKLAALPKRALEAVVLKEAEARAKSYRPEQSEGVHQLWHAAVRRMRAARDLRNASNVAAAGTLYREAGVLTARAVALAAGESFADAAAWPRVRELAEQGALPRTPPSAFADGEPLDEAQDLAEQTDALLLDAVPPVVARQRLDRIDRALVLLLQGVEPRSPKQVRRSRILRIATLALLIIAAIVGLFAWLLAPKNVALGKPTLASSYWPGSATAEALVNGQDESPWGSATGQEDGWFRVDLLAPHRIDRVVVTNRKDNYAYTTTPLAVELSSDGESFQEVRRFTGRGGEGQRWVYRGDGQVARFVRVRNVAGHGIALCEIEVYGPAK